MRERIQKAQSFLLDVLTRRPALIVLAIVCAVIIWFAIVVSVYPTTPVQFTDIPLTIDLSGTNAAASGLSVVACDVDKISVELSGDRSQVGRLTADDLVAVADTGLISTPGEYTVNIQVESSNGIAFSVSQITPAQAVVRLDKIETRTFEVTPNCSKIKVTAGHEMNQDDIVCEPDTIDITGPSAKLSEIEKVEAVVERSQEIDSTYVLYTDKLNLYADEGLLDTEGLDIPTVDFQISIPVLTTVELPLTYDILGIPSGFDEAWLRERLSLSVETIKLASQTSTAFTDMEGWYIGYVNLSDIKPGFSKTFDLELEEAYINRSGIEQVTLTLDDEGLSSRDFIITQDNITVVNAPGRYDFEVVTQQMSITVIGPEEELNSTEEDTALTSNDIVVTVDLKTYNAEQAASFSWPPGISFMGKEHIWASGSYRIAIDRLDEETDTAEETEETDETEAST